jgi:hypothetical protein
VQAEDQKAWSAIFANLGFERVVFLRWQEDSGLNGMQVLNDVQLGQPRAGG